MNEIYPPAVIKHGLLENTLSIVVIFQLKAPFRVDFQLPHLITGGCIALCIVIMRSIIVENGVILIVEMAQ